MICIGNIKNLQSELESMITLNYPNRLSDPKLINKACEYERALQKKGNK